MNKMFKNREITLFYLVDKGRINLDFTLSEKDGKIRDHGFFWRIQQEFIESLYLSRNEIQLI